MDSKVVLDNFGNVIGNLIGDIVLNPDWMPQQIPMVVGFMFTPKFREVVLIKKLHPTWQAGRLNGVGGKMEPEDDNLSATMVREFQEETGVATLRSDWTEIVTLRGVDWQVAFFFAELAAAHAVRSAEDEQVGLYDPYSLPLNAIFNLRWLIPLAMDPDLMKPLGLKVIDDLSLVGGSQD